jgi:hypothetical protein
MPIRRSSPSFQLDDHFFWSPSQCCGANARFRALAALGEEQLSADDSGSRILRFEMDSMTAWSGVVAQFV